MFAHDVNDVCELTDEDSKRLLESGHVEEVGKSSGNSPETATVSGKQATVIKPGKK